MPHGMNFGPRSNYKTADANAATVNHAQMNFGKGAGTTKKGGTNKSHVEVQTEKAKISVKAPKSRFGVKDGTGSRGGY